MLTYRCLLKMLRQFAPQFAERSPTGQFAQQDAQEAWTSIVNAMKANLKVGDAAGESSTAASRAGNFVQQFMSGEMTKTYASSISLVLAFVSAIVQLLLMHIYIRLTCTEAPDELPTVSAESFLEIKCNISASTNYMMTGISQV